MHKTCTEHTKTLLIHGTIDEVTFFCQFQAPIQVSRCPKIAILWLNTDWMKGGGSMLDLSTWKGPGMPYHIQMEGKVWLGTIFASSSFQFSRCPKMAILLLNRDLMEGVGSRLDWSTWKGHGVLYHIPMDGKVWLRTVFACSRHLSRIPGVKNGYFMAKSRLHEKGWLHFDQELALAEFKEHFGGFGGGGFNLSLFLSHLGMGQAFLAISVRV